MPRAAAARTTATVGRARAARPWRLRPRHPPHLRRHAGRLPSERTGVQKGADGSTHRRPLPPTTRPAAAVLPFPRPGEEPARRAAAFPAARAARSSGYLRRLRRRHRHANPKAALRGTGAGTTTTTAGAARSGAGVGAGRSGAAPTRLRGSGPAATRVASPTGRSAVATAPGTGTRVEAVSAGTEKAGVFWSVWRRRQARLMVWWAGCWNCAGPAEEPVTRVMEVVLSQSFRITGSRFIWEYCRQRKN